MLSYLGPLLKDVSGHLKHSKIKGYFFLDPLLNLLSSETAGSEWQNAFGSHVLFAPTSSLRDVNPLYNTSLASNMLFDEKQISIVQGEQWASSPSSQ